MTTTPQAQWLSIPEVAEILDVRQREVRALLSDHYLAAARRGENRALMIPAVFLTTVDGYPAPVESLHGTLVTLHDGGLSPDESVEWMLTEEPTLGRSPIQALLDGQVHAVRIAAGLLAI